MDGSVDGCIGRSIDEWMTDGDRWMDVWMDGRRRALWDGWTMEMLSSLGE